MRAFSLAAVSMAALALFSSAPTACGAAVAVDRAPALAVRAPVVDLEARAPKTAAAQAVAILVDARVKIAPIKISTSYFVILLLTCS